MEMAVKAILGAVSVALVAAFIAAAPAYALGKQRESYAPHVLFDALEPLKIAQFYDSDEGDDSDESGAGGEGDEADAAAIAQESFPRARVLKVRLLRNGIYAVTLKRRGNVFRVLVDVETRSIRRGL
jgi:hypothetical protein